MVNQGGPQFIAKNTLFSGGQYASSVTLPTVTMAQLPDNVL